MAAAPRRRIKRCVALAVAQGVGLAVGASFGQTFTVRERTKQAARQRRATKKCAPHERIIVPGADLAQFSGGPPRRKKGKDTLTLRPAKLRVQGAGCP